MANTKIKNTVLDSSVISGQSTVTAASDDLVLIQDVSDSNNLKKALVSDFGSSFAGIDDQSSSNDDQITITDSTVVINEDSDDIDFRVESNGNANMIFVDGGDDHVNIGTATDAGGILNVSGSSDGDMVGLTVANTSAAGTNDTVSLELQLAGSSGQLSAASIVASKGEDWSSGTSRSGAMILRARCDGTDTEFLRLGSGGDGVKQAYFSNDLGIGTAGTADTKLHLKDTGSIELRLEADSDNSGQEDCFIRFYTDGKTQEGLLGMDNNNSSTLFTSNTENAMVFGCVSNLPVVFATNNTERMQIAADGSVGIGDAPNVALEVVTSDPRLRLRDNTAGGGSGNGGKIEFAGFHAGSSDGTRLFAEIHGLKQNSTGGDTHGHMLFLVNTGSASPSEIARFDHDGAFCAGSTATFENERVNIKKTGSNDDAVLALDHDTGDASFYRFIRFYKKNNNESLGKIDYDNSGDAMTLAVESDERYKTITGPADGMNLISKLEPIKYTRPAEGVTDGCGFGAQSYKQAFDDIGAYARGLTVGSDTEKWMLDFSPLVPNLVKAVQELEARIAELEG